MNSGNSIRKSIQALESQSSQLNAGDLRSLTDLFPIFDALCEFSQVPSAFKGQCTRAKKMVESAILGDSPIHSAIIKLQEVIKKMGMALERIAEAGGEVPLEAESVSSNSNLDLDLIGKFISNQRIQLDDFEAYVLEMEKGNTQAKEEVRRYLHTLKGEFGVLDLPEYSELVHFLEDSFLSGGLTMDHLFRFKDWLLGMFPALNAGTPVHLKAGDYAQFGIQLDAATDAKQTPASDAKQPVAQAKPIAPPATIVTPAPSKGIPNLDPSFIVDFITESREHIHTAETKLLDLESDPSAEEPLNAVFRSCHTIKGLAGFLELVEIQRLAHATESLMDRARNHQITLTQAHTDLLLTCSDCMKELINNVEFSLKGEHKDTPPQFEDLLIRLANIEQEHGGLAIPAAPTAKIGEILIDAGLVASEKVVDSLDKQKAGDHRKIGEILMVDEGVSPRVLGQALGAQVQAKQQAQMQSIEESVRVPVARLDQLIDAIGEAVIAQSMIVADHVITDLDRPISIEERDALRRKVARAELIMRQIQELSMGLRMVSIKGVFQKMARLVRDLSKKLDKKVDFVMEGENTELDKSVVENIGDPLVHMVRNAIDHGIESTEERLASGKPEVARVVLRAFHKAGSVYIEIEDDGRGINREKVIAKAIEQGLIASGASMTDSEAYQLIFKPGFSTAAKVTDVSGRGVGMDVVKRNIESLRGSTEISSELGKGSCFSIRLPLTLAIIDGMVIRVGKERFILPTLQVIETLKPEPGQVESILGKGEVIHLRKDIVRVARLSKVLGAKSSFSSINDGVVLIVEDSTGGRCGLAADEILDQQQVVIKNIGGGMAEVPGISGGAIMNNGEVSLILDVSGIMRLFKENT